MSVVLVDTPAPGVARITLNRPEARNAGIGSDLTGAMSDVLNQSDVRCVILTGAGGNFCAGGDIKNFGSKEPTAQLATVRAVQAMVREVVGGLKPVVAAVEGYAAGAGVGLAAMCDVVVGDANSTFLLPFVQIGMVPDLGLHATLSYRVGLARARRMLLMADRSDGKQAFTIGLVDVLAAPGEVQDRALEVARKLANGPASAIASMKRGICVAAAQLDAVLEYEAAAMTVAMTGVEVREGAQAFREHRPPQFR